MTAAGWQWWTSWRWVAPRIDSNNRRCRRLSAARAVLPCPGTDPAASQRGHAQLVAAALVQDEQARPLVSTGWNSWFWNLCRDRDTTFRRDTSLWFTRLRLWEEKKKCGCRWRLQPERPLLLSHTNAQTAAPRPPEILANKRLCAPLPAKIRQIRSKQSSLSSSNRLSSRFATVCV